MTALSNPEPAWERRSTISAISLDEIERRIGTITEPYRLLTGGHANLNVQIGDDRILRIYRRDQTTRRKEQTLLTVAWHSLRVPRVLGEGADFLVLEYVPHRPLQDSADQGAAIGRALAEIHARRMPAAGFLAADLAVSQPLADLVTDFSHHAVTQVEKAPEDIRNGLLAPLSAFLDRHADKLRACSDQPVLLHGDFKVSNLHAIAHDQPLVLDWEFAYAGPALLDIGQLLRWRPPDTFLDAFATAYRDQGGVLPSEWCRLAEIFDLFNLAGLLADAVPGSNRHVDVRERIMATIAADGPV